MSLIFYAAPMSSASPVTMVLDELEVPHERITLDLKTGDQNKPEFLRLNPNGKVPTLVVDGTPMFEALAIMQWLGDRYGVERGLWPATDDPARLTALSWTTWAYVSYGAALQRLNSAGSPMVPAELHNPALAEHTRRELGALLAILDRKLGESPYLLGERCTIADVIVASPIWYGTICGMPVERHARVKAWYDLISARPSFRNPNV